MDSEHNVEFTHRRKKFLPEPFEDPTLRSAAVSHLPQLHLLPPGALTARNFIISAPVSGTVTLDLLLG